MLSDARASSCPPAVRSSCSNEAAGDRVAQAHKDDRDRPRLALDGSGRRGPACQDDVGLQAEQLPRERWYPIGVIAAPTHGLDRETKKVLDRLARGSSRRWAEYHADVRPLSSACPAISQYERSKNACDLNGSWRLNGDGFSVCPFHRRGLPSGPGSESVP